MTKLVEDQNFLERYVFFRKQGYEAFSAKKMAEAEMQATKHGLVVFWDDEDEPYDGDAPAPAVYLWGCVVKQEDMDEQTRRPKRHADSYASLGGVALNSFQDPYRRVCEADLFLEALGELDKQFTSEAMEMNERATYAMNVGGVNGYQM